MANAWDSSTGRAGRIGPRPDPYLSLSLQLKVLLEYCQACHNTAVYVPFRLCCDSNTWGKH